MPFLAQTLCPLTGDFTRIVTHRLDGTTRQEPEGMETLSVWTFLHGCDPTVADLTRIALIRMKASLLVGGYRLLRPRFTKIGER